MCLGVVTKVCVSFSNHVHPTVSALCFNFAIPCALSLLQSIIGIRPRAPLRDASDSNVGSIDAATFET